MSYLRNFLSATACIPLAGMALAVPATQEGADRIAAGFQPYFGGVEGVVRVVPAGDLYRLTLDLSPLAAQAAEAGATVTVSPLKYELVDQGDGTWSVTENQSFSFDLKVAEALDYTITLGNVSSEGIWDEALGYMSRGAGRIGDMQVVSSVRMPDGTAQDSSTTFAMAEYSYTGTSGGAGGIDFDSTYAVTGYSQTMAVPLAPGRRRWTSL